MILSMDLGKFNTVCCIYDSRTRKCRFETIATKRSHLDHLLNKLIDGDSVDLVVMEACGPSGWISDVCKQRGLKTIVCSTNDDAWSWKNTKRKTDRDDALKLARLTAMNALPTVHVPTRAVRAKRSLLKFRQSIVGSLCKTKFEHCGKLMDSLHCLQVSAGGREKRELP